MESTKSKAPKRNVKAKIGRPTKYKPEFCQQLVIYMAQGYSARSFASQAGVDASQIDKWIAKYPDFHKAKKTGDALLEHFYTRMGLDLAQGVYPKGNVAAWIYLTKNIIGWTDRTDLKITAETDHKEEFDLLRAVPRSKLLALAKVS